MKSKRWIRVWSLSLTTLVILAGCLGSKTNNGATEEKNSNANIIISNEAKNEKEENQERQKNDLESEEHQEEVKVQDDVKEESQKEIAQEGEENLFTDLAKYDFCFASGVGSWSTELRIYEDGIFRGNFHDNEIGDTGEDYPDGTRYISSFSGRFTKPEKINDYTYKMKIEYIKYDDELSKEEIGEGIRYIYAEAYGIDNAEYLYVYLPESPISALPEGYLDWVRMSMAIKETEEELPFYGLYNEREEAGFSSYKGDRSGIYEEIDSIEHEVIRMMEGFETMPQQEMNRVCEQVYILWDDELNSMWKRIKEKLDEEEMEQLTKEQREWIAYKEEKVKAAGAEFEGGSAQPMVEYDVAAQITRKRVYELTQYLY